MESLWHDILSAERRQMYATEIRFRNRMAKALRLTEPFMLSTSWNEYVNGTPLLIANSDIPIVHPQSDRIRRYLDDHLKEAPELPGLIQRYVKVMLQLHRLGPERLFSQWLKEQDIDLSDESFRRVSSYRDKAMGLAIDAKAGLIASYR